MPRSTEDSSIACTSLKIYSLSVVCVSNAVTCHCNLHVTLVCRELGLLHCEALLRTLVQKAHTSCVARRSRQLLSSKARPTCALSTTNRMAMAHDARAHSIDGRAEIAPFTARELRTESRCSALPAGSLRALSVREPYRDARHGSCEMCTGCILKLARPIYGR